MTEKPDDKKQFLESILDDVSKNEKDMNKLVIESK